MMEKLISPIHSLKVLPWAMLNENMMQLRPLYKQMISKVQLQQTINALFSMCSGAQRTDTTVDEEVSVFSSPTSR